MDMHRVEGDLVCGMCRWIKKEKKKRWVDRVLMMLHKEKAR